MRLERCLWPVEKWNQVDYSQFAKIECMMLPTCHIQSLFYLSLSPKCRINNVGIVGDIIA